MKNHFFYTKLFLLGITLLLSSNMYAQKKQKTKTTKKYFPTNLENFDMKRIHFGFVLGINSADFILDNKFSDSLRVLESQKQSGFNLGIISDLHIGPYFNLRFIPTLSFAQRNLEYTYHYKNDTKETLVKPVESTFLDFPINLKYRSVRANNFAAYVIVGAKYSYDLASQHKTNNDGAPLSEIVIKLNRHSYCWETGLGFDFFMKYFKFSTELKMSYGLNNLIIKDNTFFSDPIESLKSKIFTLSFTFEG
jgi:hypothetical protein